MTLKKRPLLLTALLASPLLFAFDLRMDELSFHPEDGSSVDREVSVSGAMYIDDLVMNVDGEEMPSEMLGEVLDMAFEVEMTTEVTDEYVKSRGGKSLVLLRTFNELSMALSVGGEEQDSELSMDIIDSTVKFSWNEEEEEYDVTIEEGSGDDEDLASLDVDMDFTFLLPSDEVKEGSTWEITGGDTLRMFLPGGTAGGSSDGVPEEALGEIGDLAKEVLMPQVEDALEDFVVECTYKGEDDDGGAQIEIAFEGELSLDFSELIMAAIEMQDMGGLEFDADITLTIDLELEGKGMLTWDAEAGRASAFELATDVMVLVDGAADVEAAGEAHTAEITLELSGELEHEMSVN